MKVLQLDTVWREERYTAIAGVKETIAEAGGWLVDHRLNCDLMAVLRFALPSDRSGALTCALAERHMPVEPARDETKGTGYLRRKVPAFDVWDPATATA